MVPAATPAPELRRSQEVTCCHCWVVAGRYRVEQVLGRGGAAVVYRVLDQATGKRLALKQLCPPPSSSKPDRIERVHLAFRREFHTLTSLCHPHIVQVHDYGVDPGRGPFYTMELLDTRWLHSTPPLDLRQVCHLMLEIASALAFLHSRQLLHGDVSRKNIGHSATGAAKLLDFGLLRSVGVSGMGKGTPPYMAPEVLRGAPLDHRSDLFSLGALAYILLTGRHAYPGKSGADLERLWSRRPVPPVQLNRRVPDRLSELVVSMLSTDPLGRPASACEVIDRVRAFSRSRGASPRETEIGRGYLASSAFVGRQSEMGVLREALARTRNGQGGAVLVEAPSGMGKSRLLRELAVEAQMAGAKVIKARCEESDRGPYGVLYELVRDLMRATTPPDGLTVLHRADRALPALQRWVGLEGDFDLKAPDLLERRVRLQRLLVERILDEDSSRPLVLVVDDLQRCDEASAAVLGAVAHRARCRRRVLVVCSLRSDEKAHAPDQVTTLRRNARNLALEGLEVEEVRDLILAIFGDVERVDRLARWIYDASSGSPLRCTELARHLVERQRVLYVNGVWRFPEAIGAGELPRELKEAMQARVAALSPDGRRLAETLAVHGGQLSLQLCIALWGDERREGVTFDALNELIQNEILIGSGERLRFRHDGIREALLARLDDERRRKLHLKVGHVLVRTGGSEEAIGWHLLRGGDELRGADLLAATGTRHFRAQSFSDAIKPLEAALAVYDRLDASPRRRCELRQNLVRAGVICNREVALRHGEVVLAELRRHSGLDLAGRLRPRLGHGLALALALLLTSLRRLVTRPSRRGPPPTRSLITYLSMINYVASVKALSLDIKGVREMPALLEFLPSGSMAWRTAYLICSNLELILTGYWEEAGRNSELYLRRVAKVGGLVVSPLDLQMGIGAMRYILAVVTSHRGGPQCIEHFRKLEAMDLHFVEISGRIGRVLYHRLRGEEKRACKVEADTQLLMVQLGSMWLWESQLTWISAIAHCLTRNLPALSRSIDELKQLVGKGVRAGPFLTLARGVYHRERGELVTSKRLLTALLDGSGCKRNPLLRQATLANLAQTLMAQNNMKGARTLAREGVELGRDPRSGILHFRVLSECTLAQIEARQGNRRAAKQRLDHLLCSVGSDQPLLMGILHEASALVAHLAGDRRRARRHVEHTNRWFRPTANPALVARVEKLATEIDTGTHRALPADRPPPTPVPEPCSEDGPSALKTRLWSAARARLCAVQTAQ